MALTPLLPTAKANETPDLGPSTGIGFARESSVRANQAGNAITRAGLTATNKAVDIMNRKQAQDDQLNGFNFGVEYNTRAAQILQEESQVAESDTPLTDRVRTRLQNEFEIFSESKNMNPNTRNEFNKRAAFTDSKVNSAAAIDQLAMESVKRNFAFRQSLDTLGNQLLAGNNLQAGFDEYKNVLELIQNPNSHFNAETQTILTKEASKLIVGAAMGTLENKNPKPDELLAALLTTTNNQFDDKISLKQKEALINKAQQVKRGLNISTTQTEVNIGNGQALQIEKSEEPVNLESYPRVFADPERERLHRARLGHVSDFRNHRDAIGTIPIGESLKLHNKLYSEIQNIPADEVVHYSRQLTLFKDQIADFNTRLADHPLATSLGARPALSEAYYDAKKRGDFAAMQQIAAQAQLPHGIHLNNVQPFTDVFINQQLDDLQAAFKSIPITTPGNMVGPGQSEFMRQKLVKFSEVYGDKALNSLIFNMQRHGDDRGVPDALYQAMIHYKNVSAFSVGLSLAQLKPSQVTDLIPEAQVRETMIKALSEDSRLNALLNNTVSERSKANLRKSFIGAAFLAAASARGAGDLFNKKEITDYVVELYITKNNLDMQEIDRHFMGRSHTVPMIFEKGGGSGPNGEITDKDMSNLKNNLTGLDLFTDLGISAPGSGFPDEKVNDTYTRFTNETRPIPTGTGTYKLMFPTHRGLMAWRDSDGVVIEVSQDRLFKYDHVDNLTEQIGKVRQGKGGFVSGLSYLFTPFAVMGDKFTQLVIDAKNKTKEYTSTAEKSLTGATKDDGPQVKVQIENLKNLEKLQDLTKKGAFRDMAITDGIEKFKDISSSTADTLRDMYGWSQTKAERMQRLAADIGAVLTIENLMKRSGDQLTEKTTVEKNNFLEEFAKEIQYSRAIGDKSTDLDEQEQKYLSIEKELNSLNKQRQDLMNSLFKKEDSPNKTVATFVENPKFNELSKKMLTAQATLRSIEKENPLMVLEIEKLNLSGENFAGSIRKDDNDSPKITGGWMKNPKLRTLLNKASNSTDQKSILQREFSNKKNYPLSALKRMVSTVANTTPDPKGKGYEHETLVSYTRMLGDVLEAEIKKRDRLKVTLRRSK
jgi:hypothetical protein